MDVLHLVVTISSVIAGITALILGLRMTGITKRFGQGILASGFKKLTFGVLIIISGIFLDVILSSFRTLDPMLVSILSIAKYLCFIAGTYNIYQASKRTSEQMEAFTRK